MEGMRTCHKCKKQIRGRMVCSGDCVWHPACYPNQEALKKSRAKRKKKSTKRGDKPW